MDRYSDEEEDTKGKNDESSDDEDEDEDKKSRGRRKEKEKEDDYGDDQDGDDDGSGDDDDVTKGFEPVGLVDIGALMEHQRIMVAELIAEEVEKAFAPINSAIDSIAKAVEEIPEANQAVLKKALTKVTNWMGDCFEELDSRTAELSKAIGTTNLEKAVPADEKAKTTPERKAVTGTEKVLEKATSTENGKIDQANVERLCKAAEEIQGTRRDGYVIPEYSALFDAVSSGRLTPAHVENLEKAINESRKSQG